MSISTPQQFSLLMSELTGSNWTLAAIAALFDAGVVDHLTEPRTAAELAERCPTMNAALIGRCLDVAAVRGVVTVDGDRYQLAEGVLPSLREPLRTALRGDYRANITQINAFVRSAGDASTSAWSHTDPVMLQAQGDASTMFAGAAKQLLIPALDGLGPALESPGARFLDVGCGVGGLAISMARVFPQLGIVGLDPYEPSLALARQNVTSAGLDDRIELRAGVIEELAEEQAFDVIWYPFCFVGDLDLVKQGFERVRAALRPGGWVLTPALNPAAGAAQRARGALTVQTWGGPVLDTDETRALIVEAGLSPTILTNAGWHGIVAGRKAA